MVADRTAPNGRRGRAPRPEGFRVRHELLQFRLDRKGTAETLYVTGELDISSAAALEHAAGQTLDRQGGEFRLDLSGLTFMDSSGALALLRVHKRIEALGRLLVVVHPTRTVRLVLETLGLDRLISIQE